MNKISPTILNFIDASFYSAKPLKHYKPCRIKYDGDYIAVSSGKSVWKHRGHAKNALINHFQYGKEKAFIVSNGFKDAKEFVKFLDDNKVIEFVEFDEIIFS